MEMGSQTTLHLCYLDDSEFKTGEYYSDCKPNVLLPHASNVDNKNAFMRLAKRCLEKSGLALE